MYEKDLDQFTQDYSQLRANRLQKKLAERIELYTKVGKSVIDETHPREAGDDPEDPNMTINELWNFRKEQKEKRQARQEEAEDQKKAEEHVKEVFEDDIEMIERLEEIYSGSNQTLSDYAKKKCQKGIKAIMPLLTEMQYRPSEAQKACAVAAVQLSKPNKKLLLCIPAGKGKSRVICAIATLFQR